MIFPGTVLRLTGRHFPGSSFLPLLKMGTMFPLLQSPMTLPDCHEFSSMMESGLPMTSDNSLRTLGCILSGPSDVCMFRFLRWSWTWLSLTVGRAFPLWTPSCNPLNGEGAKRGAASEEWVKEVADYLSLLFICWFEVAILVHWWGYTFFDLAFLADIPVEALLTIPRIPCRIQLQLHLSFPDTIPAQLGSIPIIFPG